VKWDRCDQWVRLLVTALARKPGFPITAGCGVWLPRVLCRHCSSPWTRRLPVTGYLRAIYSSSECSTTHVTRISIPNKHGSFPDAFLLKLRTLHWPSSALLRKRIYFFEVKNSDYCLLVCQCVLFGNWTLTYRKKLLPPSPG